MENEIREQPDVLRRCLKETIPKGQLFAAAMAKQEIHSIFISARGTSDHAAIFGKYVFETVNGIPVGFAAPSVHTGYEKPVNYRNTLIIGISQSGQAEDVLEVMRNGRGQGCVTVGITNDEASPIAREATWHFSCEAGKEKSVAATKTFLAQMMILSVLSAVMAGDALRMEHLLSMPERAAKALLPADYIQDRIVKFRDMKACFVLSRGVNYPIALEAALKIQETCYVRAQGYAISDFHHGPFAMVAPGMTVILLAPQGPMYKDAVEILDKLEKAGAQTFIISNDEKLLERGAASIRIPEAEDDITAAFLNAVTIQQIACQLAMLKGLDPDTPRGLKKVTVTR